MLLLALLRKLKNPNYKKLYLELQKEMHLWKSNISKIILNANIKVFLLLFSVELLIVK